METNIVPKDGKFNFKPFRMFENHVLLLNSMLTVMIPTFHSMIDVFGHETLKKEWSKYEIKAAKYVQDNNDISEIEKVFNPLSKWYWKESAKYYTKMANGYRLPDTIIISDIMR